MIRNVIFVFVTLIVTQAIWAHGTIEVPISRVYNCYKEGPENPKSDACKAAVAAGGSQALYDWNGINQGAANDRHEQIIPDGQLCGGGRDLFKGMNLARNDWVATPIMANANGQFDFTFLATAPHATKYFRFYMTKDGYDFTKPLKWSDLDTPFCVLGNTPLVNGRYKLTCPLPRKSGRRIIYMIWQRSDSMEAFYACSDVILSGGTQTTSWKELTTLTSRGDLVKDTEVSLRLFKRGTEVQTFKVKMTAGQNTATEWPYYLGLDVNAKSNLVHIGQLNAVTGQITPLRSTTQNKVYINDSDLTGYTIGVDFIQPNDKVDYIYPDGINNYVGGTIVIGFDRKRYQCRVGASAPWCKQSPLYFEPGRGLAWTYAWDLLG